MGLKSKIFAVAGISALAIGTVIGTGFNGTDEAFAKQSKKKEPDIKNVIFLIGDGMGVSYTSAYRSFKNKEQGTPTEFDKYLTGLQMTYPDDPEYNITDSAAAATAMSSGVKTYNNAIAVDKHKKPVKTVLEQAKAKGMSTGLVATSEITHATPAAYGAHNESRKNMDQIADDYFNGKIKGKHRIDVLLGGGKTNFVRKDRDLTKAFQKDGYSYVTNKKQLQKDKNGQVLGLFADGGLDKAIDRSAETPSLQDMTKSAIERLNQNKKGFFLMVEGSQIDWAGHDNDIVGAMSEMKDFEKAFKAAVDFAKKDKHTLVIATADHSTGGMTVGTDGQKNWFPEPILAAKKTPAFMANEIASGKPVSSVLKNRIGFTLTKEEINNVEKAAETKNADAVEKAIKAIFDNRSHTGWTTGDHTGEEVPVYAFGPGKEQFTGLLDNTDQAKNIFKILKNRK
ncbi:alkaline phosphatase [Bacillus glycinifermentans]|uniref:alkaline phosphatase n=1 Tax=Bacillus glycinifermentans TaxID=1664069 RepID=UPI0040589594